MITFNETQFGSGDSTQTYSHSGWYTGESRVIKIERNVTVRVWDGEEKYFTASGVKPWIWVRMTCTPGEPSRGFRLSITAWDLDPRENESAVVGKCCTTLYTSGLLPERANDTKDAADDVFAAVCARLREC